MQENAQNIKKILFVITRAEYGGAQRFLHTLMLSLDPGHYAVTVASGSSGEKDFLKTPALLQGGRVIRHLVRNPNIYRDIMAVFEIRRLIKEIRPDVLFLLSSKAGFVGSLAARLLPRGSRPRVIYRIGGWTFNDPWPQWKRRLWIALERISAKWKDIIIVNNQRDYDQAQKLRVRPREQFVRIYNGLDPYKIDFLPRGEARKRLSAQIPNSKFPAWPAGRQIPKILIGTIANFYPTKGLQYLIEATSLLRYNLKPKSYKVVIIGDGAERPALERLIAERGLIDTVLLASRVPDAARLLPAFDIFVLSSLKEGFPWAVLEAMAAKVPIVATRVGAIPEIIEDRKNGFLVDSADPQGIADRIAELAENDLIRSEFGIQGYQTVLFKFNAQQMIRDTLALL